jgi:hypothetical protein
MATVSQSRKQGRKRRHPYQRTAKLVAQTKCKEGGVLLYPCVGKWDSSVLRRGKACTRTTDHSEGASSSDLT